MVLISRSIEKVKGEDDIDRYVNSGQAQLVTADLRQVCAPAPAHCLCESTSCQVMLQQGMQLTSGRCAHLRLHSAQCCV